MQILWIFGPEDPEFRHSPGSAVRMGDIATGLEHSPDQHWVLHWYLVDVLQAPMSRLPVPPPLLLHLAENGETLVVEEFNSLSPILLRGAPSGLIPNLRNALYSATPVIGDRVAIIGDPSGIPARIGGFYGRSLARLLWVQPSRAASFISTKEQLGYARVRMGGPRQSFPMASSV
jgi:hypothetical protein